jgi:His/Glu/Gln/Arg/opine family amino acid ABC transporter permease subunit
VDVIFDNLDTYWLGIRTTLTLSLLSFAGAMVIGTAVATMRVSPLRLFRSVGACYVELFFSLPLLVWALIFFFGFPKIGIIFDSRFLSGVIVLATFTGALVAEAVRAGINTVPAGQAEAARAIGLRFDQVLGHVILPQATRAMIGPLGNLFLALVRNSAVVAVVVSADDIMWRADQLNTQTAKPVWVFIGAFVAYLVITVPGAMIVNVVQRRYAFSR